MTGGRRTNTLASDKISYVGSLLVDINQRGGSYSRTINTMPTRGRQRLTPDEIEARSREYCLRYGVPAPSSGLPPFPSGRRETQQHRDWMAVYKAYNRLGRRRRGQCERCAAPTSDESVFCEEHRPGASSRAARHGAALEGNGACPICGLQVERRDSGSAGVLHAACRRLVGLAEAAGPDALDRLRSYLWPDRPPAPTPPGRLPHSRTSRVGKRR